MTRFDGGTDAGCAAADLVLALVGCTEEEDVEDEGEDGDPPRGSWINTLIHLLPLIPLPFAALLFGVRD